MTQEERIAQEELRKHAETKRAQFKEIIATEPDVEKAMEEVYNLAVSDCSRSARIHCISDHMSMGHAARNFDVDKKTIEKNSIPPAPAPDLVK